METDAFLNDYALRSFRDMADRDYIAARLCYRAGLLPQFRWAALQTIEKYLKGILLLNRVKATDVRHNLARALDYAQTIGFTIKMTNATPEVIQDLDAYGRFRYLDISYSMDYGPKLVQFDMAVWQIRRYCQRLKNTDVASMIDASEERPPQAFKLPGGRLERILEKKDDPAREALIWQNAFFGPRARKKVRTPMYLSAENAPLSLHPEFLETVRQYVHVPAEVVKAYREELEERRKQSR